MSTPQTSAKTIFLQALELITATERETYLDTQCGSDADLRREVEELLRHASDVGSFLESPPTAVAESAEQLRTIAPQTPSLGFLTPSSRADSLGRLAHYEILEVVGSGGMGIVLKAFDERLHRVVAIKVMAAPLATNAAARKRFQREARAAAAVCHDHIVTIHAVEESGDLPYLVMQCVSGLSLQQRIDRDGPLELHEILRVGMQTAAGLAAAHAQGLIHRDIKPANILLENGVERVKITDFGLARAAADASISQSGIVAGTPQYMAPEQARGEALDGRTDLFSLGSVLYAMCTGRAPFRATNSIAVLKRVCEEAPSPIREANADIPEWLVALIDKLHAKNPDDRYQTAAEVAELLGQRLAQLQNSTALPPMVLLASGGRKPPDSSAPAGGLRSLLARKRRWAIAAALLLGLAATFALAEGTGATKFTATVIRLLTPEGTLVVEMTDPGVKVTIDGEGGLVITGVGEHEVRLKPGIYKLLADKNGQPVPLAQELVTITRGDKQVVRVRLEGESPPPAAPAKVEPGAFVVLGGKDVGERKFATLAEAVLGASAGDTIEVRGNGPFITEPVQIQNQSLIIRAGAGFRPIIKLSARMEGQAFLLETNAPLVVEGLELQHIPSPESTQWQYGIMKSVGSPLHVTNCRLITTPSGGRATYCGVHARAAGSPICEFRNCELLTADTAGVRWHFADGGRFVMDNCVLVGGVVIDCEHRPDQRNVSARLSRNTLVGIAVLAVTRPELKNGVDTYFDPIRFDLSCLANFGQCCG